MPDRWNGYSDAQSDIGDGMVAVENVAFFVAQELGRRPGLGVPIVDAGYVAAEVAGYAIVARSDGKIDALNQTSGAVTTIKSGYDTTNRPTMAQAQQRLYITNNVDAMIVTDDGTSVRAVGIVGPVAAPTASVGATGSVDVGTHLIRYRYQDQTRTRLSNPSDILTEVISTTGNKISVTPTVSGDATVTHIIVEMTPEGASTFYRAAIITNVIGSIPVDITMSDAELIQQVPSSRDGDFQHLPPPITPLVTEHRNRVFWWGMSGSVAMLGWSRAGFPESFDSINYARVVNLDSGDSPTTFFSYYSDMYLVGQRSMRRLVFTSDPATGMILTVPGTLGAFHSRCMCSAGAGLVFGWGRDGMWMISAMQPQKISQDIETTLASLANATRTTERFVVYEPVQREVAFFFCASGESACKLAFIWHIDQKEWSLWRFRQAMIAGCQNSAYVDRQRLMLCDSNGYSWRLFSGSNDGITTSGVVVVTGGSSTTVVNGVNNAVPGMILYRPSTAEERLISAASGSAITLGTALGTAPTTGETVYIGSIRQRWLTQWIVMRAMEDRKRPPRLRLTVRPNNAVGQTMGQITVYYYRDWATTPAAVGVGYATDVNYSGVTTNATSITVDLDLAFADGNGSYISLPTVAEWGRAIQVEVIAETPGNGVRLYDLGFDLDYDNVEAPSKEG